MAEWETEFNKYQEDSGCWFLKKDVECNHELRPGYVMKQDRITPNQWNEEIEISINHNVKAIGYSVGEVEWIFINLWSAAFSLQTSESNLKPP